MDENMREQPFRVLVKADADGRVTAINSDAFLAGTEGWIQIDEGYSDRFRHAQGNYLPCPLVDEHGVYRYKLEGGAVAERTAEEMDADLQARPAPGMTDVELLLAMAADHEYRLCLMELGVTEDDL